MKSKLAVLISGNGSNLQAIIDAVAAGSLDAQIVVVVSNRKGAYGLERARRAQIPDRYFPLKPYRDAQRSRAEYDADLAALVSEYAPDWVVLAGWMHILSEEFLARFPNRVVNLHPALPGQFPGAHAIDDALAAFGRGEIDQTGVMVHLVPDARVDEGPVLAQQAVADSSWRHARNAGGTHSRGGAPAAGGDPARVDRIASAASCGDVDIERVSKNAVRTGAGWATSIAWPAEAMMRLGLNTGYSGGKIALADGVNSRGGPAGLLRGMDG